MPSKNRAAVIAFPGRKGPQRQARMLVRHGYGVLLFDRRGEGDSEGDPNAVGWNGDRDIKAAIAFLRERPDVDPDRIGGIGLLGRRRADARDRGRDGRAQGGRLRGRGDSIRARGGGVVLGGSGSRFRSGVGITAATAVFSDDAPPPNLNDVVERIAPRPVFFIYASSGQGGEDLSQDFYESAGEPKAVWEVPGAATSAAPRLGRASTSAG